MLPAVYADVLGRKVKLNTEFKLATSTDRRKADVGTVTEVGRRDHD